MTETDVPQPGKAVNVLLSTGFVEDRALALYPDEGIFLIHRMKQRMNQMGVVRRFDLLDIDDTSRHELSNSKP
jgi:hypothetical protein